MAVKKLIKFIRVRGRIIPIDFSNRKIKVPKIRYHQTDIQSAEKIKKEGFKLFKRSHGTDSLPFGVFTKKTDKLISLKGKTQVPVLDLTKKTKVFRDRNEFMTYGILKNPEIGKLYSKSKELDRVMNKKLDKVFSRTRKQKRKILEKTGNLGLAKLSMGRTDKALYRWKQKQDEIQNQLSVLNKNLLKSKGYDSMELLKDHGSFGKVTDTKIIFDTKKVKPFKKFLNIKKRKAK